MPKLNYLAIVVAALASFAANALWYLLIFPTQFVEALGKTQAEMDLGPDGLQASILQVIGMLITAGVMAYLMKRANFIGVAGGLAFGALTWLGFVAAVLAPMYAYEAFGVMFFVITAGSVLLTLLISGAILGAWR